ncbi:MAG: vWA domain-containing protein [Verrucomicrobiota bacterium]
MTTRNRPTTHYRAGFGMLEAMFTVALIGIIAALGMTLFPNVLSTTKISKLQSDVASLNGAVKTYVAFNGNLNGVSDPNEVIRRMKSIASDTSKERMIGLRGSFLDARVALEMQSDSEASSDEPRAYWNPTNQSFYLANNGPPGIKKITLDASEEEAVRGEEDREAPLELASNAGWIWDFEDGTQNFSIAHNAPNDLPNAFPGGEVDGPRLRYNLQPPTFSISSGTFHPADFDLSVYLSDANPAGAARIVYRIGNSSWETYTGAALSVEPDSIVHAQAVPIDSSRWKASSTVTETYGVDPVQLDPPLIIPSDPEFEYGTTESILVSLSNPNATGVSRMEYTLSGNNWVSYNGSFSLSIHDFPNGAEIRARAVSTRQYYFDSSESDRFLNTIIPPDIFGIPLSSDTLFIIDVSGSMNGQYGNSTRLEAVLLELQRGIAELSPELRFGVVTFSESAEVIPQRPGQTTLEFGLATAEAKDYVISQLGSITAAGTTNYAPALSVTSQFNVLPEQVIFLTDGAPKDSYDSEVTELSDLSIPVNTIGLNLNDGDGARDRLRDISQRTRGRTHLINL